MRIFSWEGVESQKILVIHWSKTPQNVGLKLLLEGGGIKLGSPRGTGLKVKRCLSFIGAGPHKMFNADEIR